MANKSFSYIDHFGDAVEVFPVFEFDPEMLKSLDIDTFAFYSKFHNAKVESKPSLDSQIRDAKEQAPEKGPTSRDPHELQ